MDSRRSSRIEKRIFHCTGARDILILSGSNTCTRSNTMGLLNTFSLTVWATPLIVGFAMSQCLRRKMRPIGRAAMWIAYLAWGWGWISVWDRINSGGSGRVAVEQLIIDWSVKGTTLLGGVGLVWAEFARRGDVAAG